MFIFVFINNNNYYIVIANCFIFQGEFREENFQKAMAVIREGGTDPGSQRGRKGGTKGMQLLILLIQFMIWA